MKIDHGLSTTEGERYRYVYLDRKTKIPEHVYIWEQLNGPKPKCCDIHHIDGNGKNNDTDNLVCLTKSEHKTLHAILKRRGIDVVDGSDPNIIASRARNNALTKAHRQAHLEEERAKDREERIRNKDRIRERAAEFYQRHREKLRAEQAEYEKNHKAERAARNAKFYQEHKVERQEYNRKFREANREKIKERQQAYNAQHVEEIRAYRQAYRHVHAANERLRKAIIRGDSEERITQLRSDLVQIKEEFKQQQKGKK